MPKSLKRQLSKPQQWLKYLLLLLCLLYLSIYIPMAGVIYTPFWYKANCNWHPRCAHFGESRAAGHIDELAGYMRHTKELASPAWTKKERWHLAEVRQIFDRLFLAAIAAAGLLTALFNKDAIKYAALSNIALMLLLCGVLPFFTVFWRDIFHGWLFDNAYWRNNPGDVSFYIMPRVFFKHTMMLLMAAAGLVNAGSFLAAAGFKRPVDPKHSGERIANTGRP